MLIKVPLALWIFAVYSYVLRLRYGIKLADLRDQCALLAPAILIFICASAKDGFSEHMRYVLPCFPFAFVWVAVSTAALTKLAPQPVNVDCIKSSDNKYKQENRPPFALKTAFSWICMAVLLVWFVTSSLWIYPHSLSYFNELVSGPLHGPEHLLGSCVDWGQDLVYLKRWNTNRTDNLPLHLAYYGFLCPADIGIPNALPFPEADENTSCLPSEARSSCYYAISISLLDAVTKQ
jgi:hypothetical protein